MVSIFYSAFQCPNNHPPPNVSSIHSLFWAQLQHSYLCPVWYFVKQVPPRLLLLSWKFVKTVFLVTNHPEPNSRPLDMCIFHTVNQTLGCLFMFEHRSVSSWESYVVIFFLAPTWGVPNPLDMPRPPRTHGNAMVTRWPRGGHASLRALELGPSATAQTSTYRHQTMYLWLNRSLCN